MTEKYHGIRVGDVRKNKQGQEYEIEEINGCKHVKVRFLSNGWEKITTAHYASTGVIRLPKWYVGDIVADKMGNPVKIVEIVNSSNYLFEWEDGYQRRAQSSTLCLNTLMREEDSARVNPKIKVGQIYTNLQGYDFEIIERVDSSKVKVKFLTEIPYETWCYGTNISKGTIHYPFAPTVAGHGILGLFPVDVQSYEYKSWSGMLKRVYEPRNERAAINYGDCSVSESWLWFENFHKWASRQIYKAGWHLDKDLLVPGNRVYHEDGCIYLPREINAFLTDRANERGPYPLGVTLRPDTGRFQASCNNNGSPGYLGVYDTPEEAFYVYKQEKERLARELAAKWRGVVDDKAVSALMNYSVNITD